MHRMIQFFFLFSHTVIDYIRVDSEYFAKIERQPNIAAQRESNPICAPRRRKAKICALVLAVVESEMKG